MSHSFEIDKDIRKSKTLPASFYYDAEVFEALKEKVFYRSWQWIENFEDLQNGANSVPFDLLPGFLTEPIVLTKDSKNNLHCLSNVCTHRGYLVVKEIGSRKKLSCGYHGRRFALDGSFEFMPEFGETEDFPSACDNLHKFPLESWGPFLFAGLNPAFELAPVLDEMNKRVGFLPLDRLQIDKERSKDYKVASHWALYCDNFLEGFHIPFVHQDLNAVLDYGNYETVISDYMNLQIGYASGDEDTFDFPEDHIDYGKEIGAYYFWLFPNMMFNFYPWGVSVNLVEPISQNETRVRFISYVSNPSKLDRGAGSGLDQVEIEDEEVVEGVQKGLRSRFYKAGRFSPTREKGVHHFHRLLAQFLNRE